MRPYEREFNICMATCLQLQLVVSKRIKVLRELRLQSKATSHLSVSILAPQKLMQE
jgi:hypothetical protein